MLSYPGNPGTHPGSAPDNPGWTGYRGTDSGLIPDAPWPPFAGGLLFPPVFPRSATGRRPASAGRRAADFRTPGRISPFQEP